MTKTVAISALLLFAACGGSPKSTATTQPTTRDTTGDTAGGPGGPSVDPTLPSWAPKSCFAYHKVTIEAMSCAAISQSKRDEIQQQYGAASQGWKAEQHADASRVGQISAACDRSSEAVHADIAGNCAEAK